MDSLQILALSFGTVQLFSQSPIELHELHTSTSVLFAIQSCC
jgi:hypothetical protein